MAHETLVGGVEKAAGYLTGVPTLSSVCRHRRDGLCVFAHSGYALCTVGRLEAGLQFM